MPVQFELLPSVHDVMPHNLELVEGILNDLESAGLDCAMLLVVPGLDWGAHELDRLRAMAGRGHDLAGHGWLHRMGDAHTLQQRLHSWVFSRGVAEHLTLDRKGIIDLVGQCNGWFATNALPPPLMYVPPAWALGCIQPQDLAGLGFRYVETLSGIYDIEARRMHRIPLVGFEADTAWRGFILRGSNLINQGLAVSSGMLRLSIHPNDPQLKLGLELARFLSRKRPIAHVTRM